MHEDHETNADMGEPLLRRRPSLAHVVAQVDDSAESLNKKIRRATVAKVPNVVVVGGRDEEQGAVTWRRYVSQKEQISLPLEAFVHTVQALRAGRLMDNFADTELPKVG